MQNELHSNEFIEKHTVYRYVGPGYVVGIPARDLTEADLAGIWEREGLTRVDVEASGLYVAEEMVEVTPFCGIPTADGSPCRRTVPCWGDYCFQHKEDK